MSYRFTGSYSTVERTAPSAWRLMLAALLAFILISFLVLLAGRVPFTPTPTAIEGSTYRDYVSQDRTLLDGYGYTTEGNVHIPIDRAMDLLVERGLPVSEDAAQTP